MKAERSTGSSDAKNARVATLATDHALPTAGIILPRASPRSDAARLQDYLRLGATWYSVVATTVNLLAELSGRAPLRYERTLATTNRRTPSRKLIFALAIAVGAGALSYFAQREGDRRMKQR
jgi:hypothetical protein